MIVKSGLYEESSSAGTLFSQIQFFGSTLETTFKHQKARSRC